MPILINQKNIARFLENYHIGRLLQYQKIKFGFANKIVKLRTTKGSFILKIAVRNNPYKVKYEVDLLNFIKNLPTPKPIKAKNGEYLLNYNSTNKAFIYKYLAGRQISNFSQAQLRQVGDFLGKLHRQTSRFHSPIKRFEFYTMSKSLLKERVSECYGIEDKRVRANLIYIKENLPKYFLAKKLPQGAIHIDFKPENSIFHKDKLKGVVDFDNSYIGPLIFDLAVSMTWFCSKEGKFDVNKAKTIYRAYENVRKISDLEKNNLFEALHLCMLGHVLAAYYHLAISSKSFNKEKKEWYINDIKRLRKHINWLVNNLLETEKELTITKEEFNKIFN